MLKLTYAHPKLKKTSGARSRTPDRKGGEGRPERSGTKGGREGGRNQGWIRGRNRDRMRDSGRMGDCEDKREGIGIWEREG